VDEQHRSDLMLDLLAELRLGCHCGRCHAWHRGLFQASSKAGADECIEHVVGDGRGAESLEVPVGSMARSLWKLAPQVATGFRNIPLLRQLFLYLLVCRCPPVSDMSPGTWSCQLDRVSLELLEFQRFPSRRVEHR